MSERLVDILREDGSVIGVAGVEEAHAKDLLHRSVHVLVINGLGKIFIRKRPEAGMYPGLWTSSVGTHVIKGDTPEATAAAGLRYFLDLEVSAVRAGDGRVHDSFENEIITVFTSEANAIPSLNPSVSSEGIFVTRGDIEKLVAAGQTTPHLAAALACLPLES